MSLSKLPKPMSGRAMTGILKVPIERPSSLVLAHFAYDTPKDIQSKIAELAFNFVRKQENERLSALAKHYGVDLSKLHAERTLLIFLAADFIIGFCDSDGRKNMSAGRTKSARIGDAFDLRNSFDLMYAVHQLQSDGKHTASSACKLLKERQGSKLRSEPLKNIRERFYRAEKSFRDSFAYQNRHPFYKELYSLIAPFKPDFLPKKLARPKRKVAR